MKGELNINVSKIGLDDKTTKLAESYIESAKLPSKKVFRLEVDEESKGILKGIVATGIIGIISLTAVSIFKTIYGGSNE